MVPWKALVLFGAGVAGASALVYGYRHGYFTSLDHLEAASVGTQESATRDRSGVGDPLGDAAMSFSDGLSSMGTSIGLGCAVAGLCIGLGLEIGLSGIAGGIAKFDPGNSEKKAKKKKP